MRNIVVLIKNNLKMAILVKPFNFIISLLAPFVILMLFLKFNFGGASYINIAIIDEDKSLSSNNIINEIKDYDTFNIVILESEEELEEKITLKEIAVGLKIEEGFEKTILENIEDMKAIIYRVEEDDSSEIIKSIVKLEKKNLKEIALSVKGEKELYYSNLKEYQGKKADNIAKESLNDLYKDYLNSRIFVGFIISFVLTKGIKHAYRIFGEKRNFIYNRIFMAPIKTYEYYIADFSSGFIDILIQVILSAIGIKVLNVNLGVPSGMLILILSLVGLVGISLCAFLRTFTRNENELSNIYNFIYIVLVMLGGAFIPLESLPKVVNKISYINPVRWASDAIIKIQQGSDLKDIGLNLIILFLFTLVFMIIGIYRTQKEDKINSIS